MAEFSRIAKNARLGDGCIPKKTSPGANVNLSFMSTDLELLKLKRQMCEDEGFICREYGTQKSGYGGTKTIYNFFTRVNPEITKVADTSITDLIKSIDKEDIFLWYMDDGSWHKNQNLCHLYCNMLDDEECEVLIQQIEKLFGIRPRIRKDRKKDGRSFNYLYFPRKLTIRFRPEFKEFVMRKGLTSMYYKFGGITYNDPVENLSRFAEYEQFDSLMRTYATARRYDKDVKIKVVSDVVSISWFNTSGKFRERTFITKEAI